MKAAPLVGMQRNAPGAMAKLQKAIESEEYYSSIGGLFCLVIMCELEKHIEQLQERCREKFVFDKTVQEERIHEER